ncbi:outer membrane protein assembly factor BamD [Bizionia gelidisalsuginis]|uniref:Outer membrane protein assembly factor BamD n=2 Tax=Bizionia TaxID=283785 RepID=A0A8H2LFR1_9FLAO|nr:MULTISPECIES: outer membrane protein assembly factor BamD [Bizionia]TYB77375.1 outer membrane protein assembly factor BamD [Bizionia saleffrena]TYC17943.1 outer membrane protein assembly factor BamD [Bizionia gelidisalsuginis]
MKNLFYILITFLVLSSCSEYQKALKSEDIAVKFKKGEELYNAGKYSKANKLFEQIIPSYRGKPQAEKLMYLNANASYEMEDYYVSSYHFERFVSAYPTSEKIEEATFKSAKSYYKLSPAYSKDQSETITAIEKLQEFVNIFPESEDLSEANQLVKELVFKLEKKAFEIAKQYNHISDFKASMASFDTFIIDFPGAQLREDALYYRFDSAYQLAMKSVEYKKKDRLETAKKYYMSFKQGYANSQYLEKATDKLNDIEEELENYSTKS